jgi:hypothetical protein
LLKDNAIEVIYAYGHKNILATHRTTLEITKEPSLTKFGDCIIAIKATKGAADLSSRYKEAVKKAGVKIVTLIESCGQKEIVTAEGSPQLLLSHPTDMVIRKSNYVCERTIAVKSDKAAYDLSRSFIKKNLAPFQEMKITLMVKQN